MNLFLNHAIRELDGNPCLTPAQETMLRLLRILRDQSPDAVEEVELDRARLRVCLSGVSAEIRLIGFSEQMRIEAPLPIPVPADMRTVLSREIHRMHGELYEGCFEFQPGTGLCTYRLACHYGRAPLTQEQIQHALAVAAKETGVYASTVSNLLKKRVEGM